jgi:Ankyrin repeats (3 copies)
LHLTTKQDIRKFIEVLLKYGADDSRDDSNQTTLHLASRAGYVGLVQPPVEHGADIDVRNNKGCTLHEEASVKGRHDVMQLLLGYGTRVRTLYCTTVCNASKPPGYRFSHCAVDSAASWFHNVSQSRELYHIKAGDDAMTGPASR